MGRPRFHTNATVFAGPLDKIGVPWSPCHVARRTFSPGAAGSRGCRACELSVALLSPDGVFKHQQLGGGGTRKHPGKAGPTHVQVLTSTGSGQRAQAAVPKDRAYSVSLRLSCSSMRRWGTEGRHGLPEPGPTRGLAPPPSPRRPPHPSCPPGLPRGPVCGGGRTWAFRLRTGGRIWGLQAPGPPQAASSSRALCSAARHEGAAVGGVCVLATHPSSCCGSSLNGGSEEGGQWPGAAVPFRAGATRQPAGQ